MNTKNKTSSKVFKPKSNNKKKRKDIPVKKAGIKVNEMRKNKKQKMELLEKYGQFSMKELRGYALFAQILDERGFQTPAHWDNWKWNSNTKTLSVKVHWWQTELESLESDEDGEVYHALVQRSAWVNFEDVNMTGNSIKGFFKRFKNAPHAIDWSEVSALKERALPEPVEEGEDE